MRILIAGCGDVGSALGVLLRKEDHEVFGIRRNVSRLPRDISGIAADLSDPSTLRALPEVEVLVYAAAADERTEVAYRRAYIDGLENVLGALPRPPQRALFTSSTAVYGQDDGSAVDEESETSPKSFSGALVLEGERALHAFGAEHSIETSAVRLSGIYGPGRTRLVRRVASGEATLSDRVTNRIHRDDCAGALAHLLTLPALASCYIGVDDLRAPMHEVVEFIAAQLRESVDVPALVPAGPSSRGGNKRCQNTRLKASGYVFTHPSYKSGYPAIVREYLDAQ